MDVKIQFTLCQIKVKGRKIKYSGKKNKIMKINRKGKFYKFIKRVF